MLEEYIEGRIALAYEHVQNDSQRALEILDEVLEIEPDNIDALNGKGSGLMRLKMPDEADHYFDKSLSVKENSTALLNKGLIFKQKNDFENALIFYEKAIRANPELADIINILKREISDKTSITDIGENESIKRGIELKNENKLWDSLEFLKKAIEEDYSLNEKANKLIDEIKIIIYNEFMYDDEELDPENKADILKMQAKRAILKQNDFKKVLALLDIILDMDKADTNALNLKGGVLFICNDYQKAIECFDECLHIDENYTYALFNKALTLRMMNKLSEALECFDRLLKISKHQNKVKPYQKEILDKLRKEDCNMTIFHKSFLKLP